MVNRLIILALLPVIGAATFAALYFYYYQGSYSPSPSLDIPFEQITSPGTTPEPAVDSGTRETRAGLLVVDAMHKNSFQESEIIALTSWVANRGFDVEIVEGTTSNKGESRLQALEENLKRADSFLVLMPQDDYSEAEIDIVEQFVDKGGKLVMVADPTRLSRINVLSKRFGLEFRPDYLYNTVEHDQNFRHIFIRDFQPHPLTNGLETIVLYVTGSVLSSGPGLAVTDKNTQSSLVEAQEDFYPISWGDRRNVLAIGDFTFMVPPFNSLLDNDKLLSNLVDYLTDSERIFNLSDFPHFLRSGAADGTDVLLGQDSLWDSAIQMRNGLSDIGISSKISAVDNPSRNTVFLGLYDDALQVSEYLQAGGVSVDEGIILPNDLHLEREDTAITLLQREGDRYIVFILAETARKLSEAVDALLSGEFRQDLIDDFTGVRN